MVYSVCKASERTASFPFERQQNGEILRFTSKGHHFYLCFSYALCTRIRCNPAINEEGTSERCEEKNTVLSS